MEDEKDQVLRLNKFVSHCGVCTRREAVELIKKGEVSVNGVVVTDPFMTLKESEQVIYKGRLIKPEVKKTYLLLNKPAKCPFGENPVPGKPNVSRLLQKMTNDILQPAYPFGDDDCGLVIMTNDTDLVTRLSDPARKSRIVLEVWLDTAMDENDKNNLLTLAREEMSQIVGIELMDGGPPARLGIELTAGNGVQIREYLEKEGYKLTKCDLMSYGNLNKKDLKRGWSRPLTDKEVIFLKHF